MKLLGRNGFLEVWADESDRVVVLYLGNMGNRLENVRKCFEALYGKDRFARILAVAKVEGSPDYLWRANMTKGQFWNAVKPCS